MADAIMVRAIKASDNAAWQSLWLDYLTFYETVLSPATTDATWRRLLDRNEPLIGSLAIVAERPIGLAHVVLQPSTWSEHPAAYLQDLFVAPAHRGHGAGAALIETAKKRAADVGASRLAWLTREDNRIARTLYDRVGMPTGLVHYAAPT